MDAGPDDVQRSLGPISPELVLVDPVLAERARELLPEPSLDQPRRVRYPVAVQAPRVSAPPPAPPRKRRRRQVVAIAVITFVAGAVSGNLLSGKKSSAPGVTFETDAGKPAAPAPKTLHTTGGPAKRLPVAPARTRRRAPAATTWAANVLGVTARVGRPGVTIAWVRPKGSSHVVVVRARGARRSHGVLVFRGRAASYRDVSPRPCTAYRYTIVNYDRHGHRSTGVPTSVVTTGCA